MGGLRLLVIILALLTAMTGASVTVRAGGDGLQPVLPKAKGEHCVADTQFMRRNHMKMLMHQRNETMREGVRSKPFSLKKCVSCYGR